MTWIEKYTLPTKADDPPSLDIPTATLAGAPPGAFLKAGASASDTPPTVGTKSIKISPKQTTSALCPLQSSFVRSSDLPAQMKQLSYQHELSKKKIGHSKILSVQTIKGKKIHFHHIIV